VEDTASGIAAAVSAGMRALGYVADSDETSLRRAGAEVVRSLDELFGARRQAQQVRDMNAAYGRQAERGQLGRAPYRVTVNVAFAGEPMATRWYLPGASRRCP
jgi:hypothetical protein